MRVTGCVAVLMACLGLGSCSTSEVPDEFCRAASRAIELVEESPTPVTFDPRHTEVLGAFNDNQPTWGSEASSPAIQLGGAFADWSLSPTEENAARVHSQAEAFVQQYC
jgi:hypothetical protein